MFRRDGVSLAWRRIDPGDAAACVVTLVWPDERTRDDYWLYGEQVLWQGMSAASGAWQPVMEDPVRVGFLPADFELTGRANVDRGYVRLEASVRLDALVEAVTSAETAVAETAAFAAHHARRHSLRRACLRAHGDLRDFDTHIAFAVAVPLSTGADIVGNPRHVFFLGPRMYGFAPRRGGEYNVMPTAATVDDLVNHTILQTVQRASMSPLVKNGQPLIKSLADIDDRELDLKMLACMTRAGEVLREAQAALSTPAEPSVLAILDHICPGNAVALQEALAGRTATLLQALETMRPSYRQVIGVMVKNNGASASSLRGVLIRPQLARLFGRPVIAFDVAAIQPTPMETLTGTFLHELSHAVLNTDDAGRGMSDLYADVIPARGPDAVLPTIGVAGGNDIGEDEVPVQFREAADTPRQQFFTRQHMVNDGLRVDIAPLAGWMGDDAAHDAVRHADTFEHTLHMVAYAHRESTRVRVQRVIEGGDVYQRYTPGHTPWGHQHPDDPRRHMPPFKQEPRHTPEIKEEPEDVDDTVHRWPTDDDMASWRPGVGRGIAFSAMGRV